MARAAVLAAVIALGPVLPDACSRARPNEGGGTAAVAPSSSAPVAAATPPPVWSPPEATAPPAPAPPPDPDLGRARAFAQAGDMKKVRALLEKKVRSGKATTDEAFVLHEACMALRDKACLGAIKAKHPEVDVP